MPGLVNPESGMVIYTPTYQIRNLGLAKLLEHHFNLPCYVGNDTRSLALAEHFFGESRDCMDSILVSVHQGTGSGIITKGKVFLGHNRNVGEIGHIQVEPSASAATAATSAASRPSPPTRPSSTR
jgi:N-acetylglucosamine repressor